MEFNLANRIKIVNPIANIDYYYGPYDTVEAACIAVPVSIRTKGKTLGINTVDGVVEYWWKDGVDDIHLVEKGKEQVQPDWNQTTNTAVDFIKNKPSIPAAQVNSDWNATEGIAVILNKPNIPSEVTVGNLITNAATTQTESAGEAFTGNITLHKVAKTGTYSDLIGVPDIKLALLSITTAPVTFTTGDKYYHLTDNKIYTALSSSTWNAGVTPTIGLVYTYSGMNFIYDRGVLLKISTVNASPIINIDEVTSIIPDLSYDIIQYNLTTGNVDKTIQACTNHPIYNCCKIIEVVNNSGDEKVIDINTTSEIVGGITYSKLNMKESSLIIPIGKRAEINMLFKRIGTSTFEISITSAIQY